MNAREVVEKLIGEELETINTYNKWIGEHEQKIDILHKVLKELENDD